MKNKQTSEQKTQRSKFALVDKNGDEVWVSREEFMVVYRKMIQESMKKYANA